MTQPKACVKATTSVANIVLLSTPLMTKIWQQLKASKAAFQKELLSAGHGMITTEIEPLDTYYFAEEYHQQYLHKNPNGYCGLAGTGVSCPIGLSV